jgi:hypothetical protein
VFSQDNGTAAETQRTHTGEDPVPEESKGKVAEMAQAWLAWGRKAGQILDE